MDRSWLNLVNLGISFLLAAAPALLLLRYYYRQDRERRLSGLLGFRVGDPSRSPSWRSPWKC